MNDILYIKGDAGFKAALLAKLGGTWIHGHEDYNDAVLGFSVPANIFIEDFKEAIGYSTIIHYNLSFSKNPPTEMNSEAPSKFIPGTPIKMSIWSNKNYNLIRDPE